MTTKEQIRYDHGPSFKVPFNPRPSETAGRTCCSDCLEKIFGHFEENLSIFQVTYQYHCWRPCNSKYSADQYHLSIPSKCPPWWHLLRSNKSLPHLGHWSAALRFPYFSWSFGTGSSLVISSKKPARRTPQSCCLPSCEPTLTTKV